MRIERFVFAAALCVTLTSGALAAEDSETAALACVAEALPAPFLPPLLGALVDRALPTADPTAETADAAVDTAMPAPPPLTDPRQMLVEFALELRDIRYRRGGRVPATGFDCSGFVHYVFAKVLGVDLPADSASQFAIGLRVARGELQVGDLVFFHTRGKRVSHVGIYLGDGRFIHSPASGERVRVDRLDARYWARRFAGARRPEALA
jgi:cell wall-associated NlpC family hydrolase